MKVALIWENDDNLIRTCRVLRGEDGRGVLLDTLDIAPEQQPLQPWTQAARLEIRNARGAVLASQSIIVLNPEDPDTEEVKLYWVVGQSLRTETRRIPKTDAIEKAALDELLWGPAPQNTAGFTTALPSSEEVLGFAGRTAGWGPRVTLSELRVADGTAQADFSQELRAYGGGSQRASLIHAQITRTLSRFPHIRDAQITIAGERDTMLEP
jgi:spore germination protein GerM